MALRAILIPFISVLGVKHHKFGSIAMSMRKRRTTTHGRGARPQDFEAVAVLGTRAYPVGFRRFSEECFKPPHPTGRSATRFAGSAMRETLCETPKIYY